MGECPTDCRQKEDCDRLRQVYFLVRLLVAKMGEINPVFRLGANRHPSIIGSMKERTRAFFNIPTIPTCTRYNGSSGAVQNYLSRVQPVGWLEEWSKLDNMGDAQNSPHLIGAESWQVKMRMINRDLVLPRQSLLFISDSTLRGLKLSVYVLIKILKFCTGSSAKSYQCKFAISRALGNRDVSGVEELGDLIQKVIQYYTLRGKFSSIHPELRREGIIRVEVGKEGLHFIRDSGDAEKALVGNNDEKEDEELLAQAIALSEEIENKNDEEELLRQALSL